MSSARGFRIPALLGWDGDGGFAEGRRDPVIERCGDDRRRVPGGTKSTIVALQTVVVLMSRDEEERARHVKE